jgi:DNA ligase-1
MKLPTLYKEAKTGATQEWTIEIVDNKFRSIAGQVNGQLTVSEFTVCKPKNIDRSNATSAKEQALAEAKAKWQKKKDHGYVENISTIGKSAYFEPMLAHNYNDYKDKIEFPVYDNPKLDGARCVCNKDGLWTRNGKKIVSCPHIFNELKPYLDKDPNLIFDGELYNHDLCNDFNKLMSLIKKLKPTKEDLEESEKLIQYWIYDLPSNKKFSERFVGAYKNFKGLKYCRFVYATLIHNQKELDTAFEKHLQNGFEGQIIRLDEPYQNKRTKFLLKHKEFQDAEFEIVDILEGVGNKSGMAGAVRIKLPNGETQRSNIKANWEFCDKLLKEKDQVVGKLGTVRFQNYTPDGFLRFPELIKIDRYD